MSEILFKRFTPDAQPPYKKYPTDAGFDLSAIESGEIWPGQVAVPIRTGIGIQIPPGHVGLLRDRSSLALKGITISGGVIDSGFSGEILVLLNNMGRDVYSFVCGERISQVLILPCEVFNFVETDTLDATPRNTKGFGSTGRNNIPMLLFCFLNLCLWSLV